MKNFTNTEIVEYVLRGLAKKIGRRTSEGFAVVTIDTIIKELRPKYDFLKYVLVQDTTYSEGINAVSIMPDMDYVEHDELYRALDDVIKSAVRHLKRKADYFFIREFKEIFDGIPGLDIEKEGISLNQMQLEYIVDRTNIFRLIHSEIIENVIKTLICLLNKVNPEKQAIDMMITSVEKLKQRYSFLKYVDISPKPDSNGFYTIGAMSGINNVSSAKVSDVIQKLIEEIGMLINWENEKEAFNDAFKKELGEEQLGNLQRLGINLNHIQTMMAKKEHENIAKNTLKALVVVVGRFTSEGFAIITIHNAIKDLSESHNVLRYIKIDESQYSKGANAIEIIPDINTVESYELAKALRDIIKMTGTFLDDKNTSSFIEEFKKELGDEYLQEVKKIGVNLHFLELKFA